MKFSKVHILFWIAGCLVATAMAFLIGVLVTMDTPVLPDLFSQDEGDTEATGPIYSYALAPDSIYEEAYDSVSHGEHINASSAIVAHHLLVAGEIAELFASIGSTKTDTVVLLSPNHFNQGSKTLQTSLGSWDTPFGRVQTNEKTASRLLSRVPELRVEEETFESEHGVSAVVPFIAKSFPNADIVPIVVHDTATAEDLQMLSSEINDLLPNAVIIASVDMSHNLPTAAQSFHDAVTLRTIEGNSFGTFDELDLETDTNAVLKLLYAINEERGEEVWTETYSDASLSGAAVVDWKDNTSHIIGYFTKGQVQEAPFAALHVVGDIMLDRGTRIKLDAFGIEYPWEEMGRFLRGTHQVVGNLEGTVNEQSSTYTYDPPFRFVFSPESVEVMGGYVDVVSLANNHTSDVGSAGQVETMDRLDDMNIDWFGSYASSVPHLDVDVNGMPLTYIGYHQFQPNLEDLQADISAADEDGRFVIVYPHWGNEYIRAPQANQRALAQIMVDAGADLIIGGHPHVPQGIEVIDDVLVVYSLGNFIFDQQIPETWQAMTVGVIIDEERVELYLMPVYTKDSQPVPSSDEYATKLFTELADLSTESLQSQIQSGIITLPYER